MDTTSRFGDRVDDYVRYRPSYPRAVLETLERDFGLSPAVPVADIGSGTGISARLFVDAGYVVFAVEPNEPMRRAAEDATRSPGFHSVDGTAEATTLEAASVGLVVAAQAFHWFDHERARDEMKRILRPPGLVALVWNERRVSGPFLEAYEALLVERGVDYGRVRHQDAASPAIIERFFGPGVSRSYAFPNTQRFDREGLFGRALSSSYVPKPGHPLHEEFVERLGAIWTAHQTEGGVAFEYDTRLYVGRLGP